MCVNFSISDQRFVLKFQINQFFYPLLQNALGSIG